MAKGIYIGIGNNPTVELPEGYTQLEYIESSGTQYIDTGFTPNQDTRVVMDAQLLSDATANEFLFGGRTSSNASDSFAVCWYITPVAFRMDYGSAKQNWDTSVKANARLNLDFNKNMVTLNGTTKSLTASTFTGTNSMYIFACNTNGSATLPSTLRLYSFKIYDNGTLVRNFITAKNSSGTIGLYDLVNSKFYTNAGSGTFTAGKLLDGSSFARKVNKMYVGVENIARKVKKGYIGVNGIARLFFASGVTPIRTNPTPLSVARIWLAGASVGDYALFAGGCNIDVDMYYQTVDAYNENLTRSNATALSNARFDLSGASVGDYAIFAGGVPSAGGGATNTVDAYNANLTKSSPNLALNSARAYMAGAGNETYAIFAGGNTSAGASSYVDAYYSDLTRVGLNNLNEAKCYLAGARAGNYAIFAGGTNDSSEYLNGVDAYGTDGTHRLPQVLSVGRPNLAGASTEKYAIFAGGGSVETAVDAYDENLTRIIPTALSIGRHDLAGASVGNYAFFAGGNNYAKSPSHLSVVDMYDENLTRTALTDSDVALTQGRFQLAAVSVGEYAIFAGGRSSGTGYTQFATVDAYSVA